MRLCFCGSLLIIFGRDVKKMKKIIFALLLIITVLSAEFCYASNHENIENIIAGKQDKLVLATVSKVGPDACTVYVVEEIGETSKAQTENDEVQSEAPGEGEAEEPKSIAGTEIEVAGFNSYMYFEGLQYPIQIGHNVLLSLTFNGNVYHIKNGAFHINSATHDRNEFKFIAPERVDGEDASMELTALYYYITSDGKNADFAVKDSVVITHDANTGETISINEQTGITFINEQGETTKDITVNDPSSEEKISLFESFRWIIALVILITAFFTAPLVAKLIKNLEKRSETK